MVIDYIDKLEKVSKIDEAKFKAIVFSRKEDNKKKKQQAQKIKSEDCKKTYFVLFKIIYSGDNEER